MAFRAAPQRDPLAPRRAALYLRVSTGRQVAGDVSIPSQRDLTRRYCEAAGLGCHHGVYRAGSFSDR